MHRRAGGNCGGMNGGGVNATRCPLFPFISNGGGVHTRCPLFPFLSNGGGVHAT
jgi:hypothetical protein